MVSKSESFFQRTLEDKTKQARQAVQKCIQTFLSQPTENRKSSAQFALEAVSRIVEMLHPEDRPPWLNKLHNSLSVVMKTPNNSEGIQHIQQVANELQVALNQHQWRLTDLKASEGFDFDSLYNKYKAENRIPELFDEIIAALTEIASSGEIDSLRVLNELNRIIATLQNARNGSYFATRNAWSFVASWFKNTGWEVLGDIPVLGPAVRGLRKSLEDMNTGMQNLHNQIYIELNDQLSKDFPKIEYTPPELPLLDNPEGEENEGLA